MDLQPNIVKVQKVLRLKANLNSSQIGLKEKVVMSSTIGFTSIQTQLSCSSVIRVICCNQLTLAPSSGC